MYRYEVTLEIINNGNRSIVRTVVQAANGLQARSLAQSMAGPGGRIVFGPYQVS